MLESISRMKHMRVMVVRDGERRKTGTSSPASLDLDGGRKAGDRDRMKAYRGTRLSEVLEEGTNLSQTRNDVG